MLWKWTWHFKKNIFGCFYKASIQEEGFSFCIFVSEKIIGLMNENILPSNRQLLLDGTFAVTPIGCFNQLLVIYIQYFDKVSYYCFIIIPYYTVSSRRKGARALQRLVAGARAAARDRRVGGTSNARELIMFNYVYFGFLGISICVYVIRPQNSTVLFKCTPIYTR